MFCILKETFLLYKCIPQLHFTGKCVFVNMNSALIKIKATFWGSHLIEGHVVRVTFQVVISS